MHSSPQIVTTGRLKSVLWVSVLKSSCSATRHGGAWGERRYTSYSFLTSALDWGWVVSITLRPRFTLGGKDPRTAGLYAEARGEILCSAVVHCTDRATRLGICLCQHYF
jgi:hypothetical protein